MKIPTTDFKIYVTCRFDVPPPNRWYVRVADQGGFWHCDGYIEFKGVTEFIEMGMQAVNNTAEKAKELCRHEGHDVCAYPTGLKYCSRCGETRARELDKKESLEP